MTEVSGRPGLGRNGERKVCVKSNVRQLPRSVACRVCYHDTSFRSIDHFEAVFSMNIPEGATYYGRCLSSGDTEGSKWQYDMVVQFPKRRRFRPKTFMLPGDSARVECLGWPTGGVNGELWVRRQYATMSEVPDGFKLERFFGPLMDMVAGGLAVVPAPDGMFGAALVGEQFLSVFGDLSYSDEVIKMAKELAAARELHAELRLLQVVQRVGRLTSERVGDGYGEEDSLRGFDDNLDDVFGVDSGDSEEDSSEEEDDVEDDEDYGDYDDYKDDDSVCVSEGDSKFLYSIE